jgi:hypothetical protein
MGSWRPNGSREAPPRHTGVLPPQSALLAQRSPAKDSMRLLRPGTTGMAATLVAKSA